MWSWEGVVEMVVLPALLASAQGPLTSVAIPTCLLAFPALQYPHLPPPLLSYYLAVTALDTGQWQALVGWDGCKLWGAVETLPCLPSHHQPPPGSRRLSCQPRRPHPGPWCHPRPTGSTRESAMPARDSEGVAHTPTGSRMPPQATPSCLRPPAFM